MSCVFCDGKYKLKDTEFVNIGDFIAKVVDGVIRISIKTGDGGNYYHDTFMVTDIPIIYCPICGEKLQKETQQ